MTKKRTAQLRPGFLRLKESGGILFFISEGQKTTLPAMALIQEVLDKTFGVPCTMVIFAKPRELLSKQEERGIENLDGFFRAVGVSNLIGMYINMRDCHTGTIQFTESLLMKTHHLEIDDRSANVEEIARTAIIEILKAI